MVLFAKTEPMIDVLIIQHEDDVTPGTTLQWASERGLSTQIWHVAREPQPLELNQFKALIICGGSMNTFEEAANPWLITEKEFIKKSIDLGKPIFGLCLGSQLLAEVLGGKVYPLHKWEVGFVPVMMKDEANPYELHVYHWHQCGFDLPPGAEYLAEGEFWRNQAFRVGSKIYATQFHPETTEAWVRECAEDIDPKYEGLVQNKKEMLESIPLLKPMQAWFFKTLDRWY